MVVRTYFDRNNTIILNDYTNTGRNPITELYYGGDLVDKSYTRFLFHFDETRLRELFLEEIKTFKTRSESKF